MTDISKLYQLYCQHQPLTTDSRDCPEGSTFLALKGDRFDGNQYAVSALQQGCAIAIVSDPQVKASAPAELADRIVVVADTLQTLKLLAREHRRQFQIPVLAITGTNGKTTTKELVAAVLKRKYNVLYTEGNLNNDIGVPKTLLRLRPEHELAVIEMGASHPGDIRTLVETAEPTCGLITNVGRAHLQGFGSFEGVCRTKGELYDWLAAHDGLVFINGADDTLLRMADERSLSRRFTYGIPPTREEWLRGVRRQLQVYTNLSACSPCLGMRWLYQKEPWMTVGGETQTQLVGEYNLPNVLAAVAVGCHFGVAVGDISSALHQYQPDNSRSQLMKTERNTLIVDAYNANPSSMELAISNLQQMQTDQPKVAVLGQMNELGSASSEEHQRVVDQLRQCGFSRVLLIGPEFCALAPESFVCCPDTEAAKQLLAAHPVSGSVVLIKGSNSFRLFELPALL